MKQVKATSEETIQSQIQQTKANLELAEADLKRAQELYGKNFIARQQLDEARTKYNVAKATYDLALNSIRQKTWENDIALAEAQVRQAKATLDLSQAQLANLIILSPMNGGVTKRYVDPGTMVKDTTPILTLMDLGEVKMVVNVIEREFVRLQKGQPVKITVTAFPDRVFPGRIAVITPALELQSRTAEIQISIPNPGIFLKPGNVRAGGDSPAFQSTGDTRSHPEPWSRPGEKDFVYVCKDDKVVADRCKRVCERYGRGNPPGGEPRGEGGHGRPGFLKDGSPVRLVTNSEKSRRDRI